MAFYNCPRISFSIDFVDPQQQPPPIKLENSYREAPVCSDFEFFEFSVPNDDTSMISADELFFKGRMLPLKENCPKITTTLRDELLANDNEDNVSMTRPVKGVGRWREMFGLKRSHGRVVPKKGEKNADGSLERIDEIVFDNFKGLGLKF